MTGKSAERSDIEFIRTERKEALPWANHEHLFADTISCQSFFAKARYGKIKGNKFSPH
jgi:hypothetical protein